MAIDGRTFETDFGEDGRNYEFMISPETERMKVQIAAEWVTTVYINMLVLLVAAFIAVFVALFTPFIAGQISVIEFGIPAVSVETIVLLGIVSRYQHFVRRTNYLDTLIDKIESNPPKQLGPLATILDELRRI